MGLCLCVGLTLELGGRERSEEEGAHSPCLHVGREGLWPLHSEEVALGWSGTLPSVGSAG